MQLFSPFLAADSAAADAAIVGAGIGILLLWLLITQLIMICSYWVASKVVAGEERSTFINAIKAWAAFIAVSLVIGVLLVLLMVVAVKVNEQMTTWCIIAGGLLIAIALVLVVPMKIYQLGFWRACGFIIVSGILSGAINIGIGQFTALGGASQGMKSRFEGKETQDALVQIRAALAGKDTIDILLDDALASAQTKSLADRHAELTSIYAKLEERHKTLTESDKTGNDRYKDQLQRYKDLVSVLNRDKAAGKK